MGRKARFGEQLYYRAVAFKAFLLEYEKQFIQPLIDHWDIFKAHKEDPTNGLWFLQLQGALADIYTPPVVTYAPLLGLLDEVYQVTNGQAPTVETVKAVIKKAYPSKGLYFLEDGTSGNPRALFDIEVEGKDPITVYEEKFKRVELPQPRAFNPIKEKWADYQEYLSKEYKPKVKKAFGFRPKPELERDATWFAQHFVGGKSYEDIFKNWEGDTGRVYRSAVYKAVNRMREKLGIPKLRRAKRRA